MSLYIKILNFKKIQFNCLPEPLIVDSKLPLWYSLISGLNERYKWKLISGMGGNFNRNMHGRQNFELGMIYS